MEHVSSKATASQRRAFVAAARAAECDQDEGRFEAKLKKIATPNSAAQTAHHSDCAMHNAPAKKPGRCTCGAAKAAR